MSEDTFGIPAEDFDYQFVQAERAMMDLDAMKREAILGDPLSKDEAQRALATAYCEIPVSQNWSGRESIGGGRYLLRGNHEIRDVHAQSEPLQIKWRGDE